MEETVRLLWGPPAGPRRGPKPALSLDRIAGAGVEIADAEGLAALSMQRVAELLGKTKMSLHRYVPGRAELVALMAESPIRARPAAARASGSVTGRVPSPRCSSGTPGCWTPRVGRFGSGSRRGHRTHPERRTGVVSCRWAGAAAPAGAWLPAAAPAVVELERAAAGGQPLGRSTGPGNLDFSAHV